MVVDNEAHAGTEAADGEEQQQAAFDRLAAETTDGLRQRLAETLPLDNPNPEYRGPVVAPLRLATEHGHVYVYDQRAGVCGDEVCMACGAERMKVEDNVDPRECGTREETLAHRARVEGELAARGARVVVQPWKSAPPSTAAAAYLALEDRVAAALDVLRRHGQTDGAHHKAWVIDQVARALLGQGYDAWVLEMKDGADGPETYPYDVGVAP